MKIFQICPTKQPLIDSSGKIYGGTEKFCLETDYLLTRAGHEVTSLVHPDTAALQGKSKTFSIRNEELLATAAKEADLVIFNILGSSGLGTLTRFEVPALMIWHMSLKPLGISKFGTFTAINNNRKVGGKLLGVSKHIQRLLNEEFISTYEWCKAKGEKYSDYTSKNADLRCDHGDLLQWVPDEFRHPELREEVKPSNGRPFVLSRAASERNPGVAMKALLDDCDYFISYKGGDDYADSLALDFYSTCRLNMPYHELQEAIGHQKVLINTCSTESAGISVFEAAVKGIPAILCVDKDGDTHASQEFLPPEGARLVTLPKRGKVEANRFERDLRAAIASFPDSQEFRHRIQSFALDKFSEGRAHEILMSARP